MTASLRRQRTDRTAVQPFFESNYIVDGITVSVGVAKVFSGHLALEHAQRRADSALYAAKAGGRNAVRCFDDFVLPHPNEHAHMVA